MRSTSLTTGQDGFTLIELLVAIAMSIPVLFALSAIMIVTLHQTQRTTTRVDATREARTALATIENELHSACVGQNTDPILAGSTPTSMQFLSYTGTDDTPTPVWHVLALQANAGSSPTTYSLVDTSYHVKADANSPDVGWDQDTSTSATSVTLLTDVTPMLTSNTAGFRYYAYQPYASGSLYDWIIPDGTTTPPGLSSPPDTQVTSATASGGLTAADAADVTEVEIGLLVGAGGEKDENASLSGTTDPLTDAISLRLTTPPDSSTSTVDTGDYGPCT